MVPALHPGDYVFTRRPGPRLQRHAIVIVSTATRLLVKRVVGLGGERVTIEGGVLAIDGAAREDPYWPGATRPDGEWVIPQESVFVLGDNRTRSSGDSRMMGAIPRNDIVAVVIGRYWPLRRSR